jgi:hypothetical protein
VLIVIDVQFMKTWLTGIYGTNREFFFLQKMCSSYHSEGYLSKARQKEKMVNSSKSFKQKHFCHCKMKCRTQTNSQPFDRLSFCLILGSRGKGHWRRGVTVKC